MVLSLQSHHSLFIRQHATNAVNWRLWNQETLAEAAAKDLPLFISIGYSSCHWCHELSRTVFDLPEAGELLERYTVPVLIDREELPDLDHAYMQALIAQNGNGGWPLNALCTPDGAPFNLFSYLPFEDDGPKAGFKKLITTLGQAWQDPKQRPRLLTSGEKLAAKLTGSAAVTTNTVCSPDNPEACGEQITGEHAEADFFQLTDQALVTLLMSHDATNGGWGEGAKFPYPAALSALLRTGHPLALQVVHTDAQNFFASALSDHISGGFFRYCTDEKWRRPHFEKPLPENANLIQLLSAVYLTDPSVFEASELKNAVVALLEQFALPNGGFVSGLSADSVPPGLDFPVEGGRYLYNRTLLREVLGKDAERFADIFHVDAEDDFNPDTATLWRNKLSNEDKAFVTTATAKLKSALDQQLAPEANKTSVLAWSVQAIVALAEAARALGDGDLLRSIAPRLDQLIALHRDTDGRLHRLATGSAPGGVGALARLEDLSHLALAQVMFGRLKATDELLSEIESRFVYALAPNAQNSFIPGGKNFLLTLPRLHDAPVDDDLPRPRAGGGVVHMDTASPCGAHTYALALTRRAKACFAEPVSGEDDRLLRARSLMGRAKAVLEESGGLEVATTRPYLVGTWLQAAMLIHAFVQDNGSL